MKNKGLKIVGGILGVIIIGFLILIFSLDGIVKSNIRQTGSNLLQTPVDVDDVSISIFNGSGTIDGITIKNPDGFDDPNAMSFKEISLTLDLSTIFSDTVVVKDLTIRQPEFYMEQKTKGNNLKILMDHLSSSSSGGSGSLIVDHFLVNDGSVKLSTDIGGKRSAEARFSQIELKGVGREGSNTTKQTVQQILEPVLKRAIAKAVSDGLLDKAKEKLQDLLGG